MTSPVETTPLKTPAAEPRPSRAGVWIVAGVLLLAMVMAGGNFLYQYLSTRDALDFWGHDAAALFRSESKMTVALLEPASGEAGFSAAKRVIEIGGSSYSIGESKDATTAGGNLHFRRALLQQRLYDWDVSPTSLPEDESTTWRYLVTFTAEGRELTIAFSDDAMQLVIVSQDGNSGGNRLLQLRPHESGVSPVQAFLDDQFSANRTGQAREF